jgi:hypothetical protein
MRKLLEKLKAEFFAILPPTIFFFVALHIVAFVRVLMTKGSHFEPMSTTSITVGALILGKAVLIADILPAINRYPDKPLAYNVAWKTAIYWLMATAIHYLERLIDFSRQAGNLAAGNAKLFAEIVWPHFWAVQIILFILIVVYCTAHELGRVVGREETFAIILRANAAAIISGEHQGLLSRQVTVRCIEGSANIAKNRSLILGAAGLF